MLSRSHDLSLLLNSLAGSHTYHLKTYINQITRCKHQGVGSCVIYYLDLDENDTYS